MTYAAMRDNQIRLTDDIYPFFDRHASLDKSESIIHWRIDCGCSSVKVKVGYALKRMKEEGLLQDFEAYLAEYYRTIGSQYEEAYLRHQLHR